MNCEEIQEYCIACAGEEIPGEMRRHMESCSDCREAYEAALTVHKLISLKKYEAPDPGFEARSLARIRTSLYQLEEERAQGWGWVRLFQPGSVSSVRYALAAMVLFLGGLYMVSISTLPSVQPGITEEAGVAPVESRPALAAATPTNAALHEPSNAVTPVLLAFSNARPGSVQYGPGASVPVSFGE